MLSNKECCRRVDECPGVFTVMRGRSDPSDMSALAAFLNGELGRRDWSNERAAVEAGRAGFHITGETVRKARKDAYKEPLPRRTIEALAAAFGVKPEMIQRLDQKRWEISQVPMDGIEQAILGDEKLAGRDKQLLLDLYRNMVTQKGTEAGRSPAPPSQARRSRRRPDNS